MRRTKKLVEVALGSEGDIRTDPPKRFKLRAKFELGDKMSVHLFATKTGRPGKENQYELPPPADADLFFGSMLLVKMKNGAEASLTVDEWKKIYTKLFKGFETLGDDDSEEEEDKEYAKLKRLEPSKFSHGYYCDGFVVPDDEECE